MELVCNVSVLLVQVCRWELLGESKMVPRFADRSSPCSLRCCLNSVSMPDVTDTAIGCEP